MNHNSENSEILELKIKLENIEKLILTKFEELNAKIDSINKKSNKMSEHIDFMEDTYTKVKAPLSFVKNKVEKLMGYSGTEPLPSIKDKDNNLD